MSAAMTIITVALTGACVLLVFVTSAAESAVRAIPLGRARRLRDSATRGAHALSVLAERPSHVSASHALATGLSFSVSAVSWLWLLQKLWAGTPVWVDACASVALTAVVLFTLGEALPRTLVDANAEDVGLAVAGIARIITAVLYVPARVLSVPWTAAARLVTGERSADVPWADEAEEQRAVFDDAPGTGVTEDDMLDAVASLELKVVREVMIPRPDMVAIEDTASVNEAIEAIVAAGVSRVPVYHETLDDIRGFLYAKDLLPALAACDPTVRPIDLARPALFVPETKPVEDLLREMRRRTHIAIVADEYGGTAGLVTIEDLLEEIVGEIFDEYDPQVAMVTVLHDGSTRIDARLAVGDLDDRFGTDLDVEADTVGGLFTELAGHIPQVGESVEFQGLRLTVEKMEGNRVRQLVVAPVRSDDDEGDRQ